MRPADRRYLLIILLGWLGIFVILLFDTRMPPPRKLTLVRHGNRDYVAWTGDFAGPFDVPSGPACYLFDDRGRLVDWQAATGDGGAVEDWLDASTSLRTLTLDEALDITQNGAPK